MSLACPGTDIVLYWELELSLVIVGLTLSIDLYIKTTIKGMINAMIKCQLQYQLELSFL